MLKHGKSVNFYKPIICINSLQDVLMHFDVHDKVSTLFHKKLSIKRSHESESF